MSREILFRAKKVDGSEWVEGYIVKKHGSYFLYDIKNSGTCRQNNYLAEKDTICQYTGLNDMSDMKIWENDIVKSGVCRGVIRYKDGCFSIKWINDPLEIRRTDLANWVHLRTIQVIGNVFDNPGLLERRSVL